MSTPNWFDPKLSIGNLITIVIVAFGIAAGWFGFDARLAMLEASQRRTDAALERVERERSDSSARLIRVEERLQNQQEILQRILRNVEQDGWRRREN